MGIDTYTRRIDHYLFRENVQPMVVDVQNKKDLVELITHYKVGKNIFIAASDPDYCHYDEYPDISALLNVFAKTEGSFFVTELSSFLKLQGEAALRRGLREILDMTIAGHVIIISYQCKKYLEFSDLRIANRICIIDGPTDKVPSLTFSTDSHPHPNAAEVIKGIQSIPKAIEGNFETEIYVETKKDRKRYPYALYIIHDQKSAYELLLQRDSSTAKLDRNYGTEDQWRYALQKLDKHGTWGDLVDSEFANRSNLEFMIPHLKNFDKDQKWLYFIALQMFGAKNHWCLNKAAKCAVTLNGLSRQAYRCLLDVSPRDQHFEECYHSRKNLLAELGNPIEDVIDFCKVVQGKGKDAIWYLTDNTSKERETIFFLLDKYFEEYSKDEIFSALKLVYPAIYNYLSPFRFKHTLLNHYFQEYKYQKVVNRIFPEFEEIVKEQAEKREYNLLLEPRSSKIETIGRTDAQLYFVDALGVEYLGYIMWLCKELNIMANVSVCRCDLPSITSRNKEFIALFESQGLSVTMIKELDEAKHHGRKDFDYQKTKLPIHLSDELDILQELLIKIKEQLSDGKIKKAILVADHGASRLAVIHETENLWELSAKGKFSGRCCPKSDVDQQPAFAVDAGDFWALANYDRFKGSRKADVEVHGGATLEEVTIPIIELTFSSKKIEIYLLPITATAVEFGKTPEIEVSFRKKAAIKIFSTVELQNVSICINGKFYDAVPVDSNFYSAEMPDIKRAKTYQVDVYAGGNLVAEGLFLIVKKEGAQEKELL